MNTATLPVIKKILKDSIEQTPGVHWASFRAVGCADNPTVDEHEANVPAVQELLVQYGLEHSADEQVRRWLTLREEVHRTFESLADRISGAAFDNITKIKPGRPTRLVLDVEVGGFLCASTGDRGLVFVATLDQQVMNDASAERCLAQIACELTKVLHPG
jgi:hypothetical protein